MLLTCVQSDVTFADISANIQRVLNWLDTAPVQNSDLVVFPECMLSGYAYDSRDEALNHAMDLNDVRFELLIKAAATYDLRLTLGFLERSGDLLFNAYALFGPEGMIGHYRKIHLPHLGIDRFVDRGDIPYQIHRAGNANIGMAICYDCSFPEPMRLLALEGADIITLGTNWPNGASRTAEVVPPARSMENHLFFAAANRVGEENGFGFCGCSSICGPDGIVLASTDRSDEQTLTAEIDLNLARNKRIERVPGKHVIHRFNDRRTEFYADLSKERDNS